MKLRLSAIPPGAKLVRFLVGDGPAFDGAIVVVEIADGRTLYLMGFEGAVPHASNWRKAMRAQYPAAREVLFHRAGDDGELHLHLLTFKAAAPGACA